MSMASIKVELSDADVIFIYGNFLKELSKIEKMKSSANCPFDENTISNNKAPYLSVVEKLKKQCPQLKKLDGCF